MSDIAKKIGVNSIAIFYALKRMNFSWKKKQLLFMRTGDGNESYQAVWRQILSDVKKQIKLDSIMVCDSALLSL